MQERALVGSYWRERLRKRGHGFFLWLEHWTQHARAAIGIQPDENVDWQTVPGYAQACGGGGAAGGAGGAGGSGG
eukprot:1087476-Pleurochrysis_carterae.AAC.1